MKEFVTLLDKAKLDFQNMITIIEASIAHIKDIQAVSEIAWSAAFSELLSREQIAYMMKMMYSDDALRKQIEEKGHIFFLAKHNGGLAGYMSVEHDCENSGKTKIHKIYVLPDLKNKGVGKTLLDTAIAEARRANSKALYLNVNKYNVGAIAFYLRNGFERIKEEVIDIGNGFVMDDYVYEKPLK